MERKKSHSHEVFGHLETLAQHPFHPKGYREIRLRRRDAGLLYEWLVDNGSRAALRRTRRGYNVRHYPYTGPVRSGGAL